MKIIRRAVGTQTWFVILESDPRCHDAILNLGYDRTQEGFERASPSDAPHLDRIHGNLERYAEEMILQRAGLHHVPWERALSAFLDIIGGEDIHWFLVGSGALAVRGLDIAPQDLDLATDAAGARRLGELLADYLVEPVQFHTGRICDWWGRAFIHARFDGWATCTSRWIGLSPPISGRSRPAVLRSCRGGAGLSESPRSI